MNKPSSKTQYERYKETQIKTASQGKLIVMLYDGAIRFLNMARSFIDEKNIEDSHKNIVKAQDIIMELLLSLNMEAGEIAQKLYNLYLYLNKKLMEANMYKKKEPIDEVIKILSEMREVWEEAASKTTSNSGSALEKNNSVNIST
ncbi:MAG: flagellar export chaperone FliS [Spirochaetes bacterium]|nr:flagellar export chaperone FliS [Spirochaetota bacterium]